MAKYFIHEMEIIDTDKLKERQHFLEDEIIILTKSLYELFRKTEYPSDCMALYVHYYYTAKWQETNIIKSTTFYTAKALKWGEARVRKIKKILINLNVIEDITRRGDDMKIRGRYIMIKYLFKKTTIKDTILNSSENHTVDIPYHGNDHSKEKIKLNALSLNNPNALSLNNKSSVVHKNTPRRSPSTPLQELPYTEILDLLIERISNNDPKYFANKNMNQLKERWYKDIRLTVERDNRPPDEIKEVINWCQDNSFWKSNILSAKKLRAKYPTLLLQMQEERRKEDAKYAMWMNV